MLGEHTKEHLYINCLLHLCCTHNDVHKFKLCSDVRVMHDKSCGKLFMAISTHLNFCVISQSLNEYLKDFVKSNQSMVYQGVYIPVTKKKINVLDLFMPTLPENVDIEADMSSSSLPS